MHVRGLRRRPFAIVAVVLLAMASCHSKRRAAPALSRSPRLPSCSSTKRLDAGLLVEIRPGGEFEVVDHGTHAGHELAKLLPPCGRGTHQRVMVAADRTTEYGLLTDAMFIAAWRGCSVEIACRNAGKRRSAFAVSKGNARTALAVQATASGHFSRAMQLPGSCKDMGRASSPASEDSRPVKAYVRAAKNVTLQQLIAAYDAVSSRRKVVGVSFCPPRGWQPPHPAP